MLPTASTSHMIQQSANNYPAVAAVSAAFSAVQQTQAL